MTDHEPSTAADDAEIRVLWSRACDAWTRGDAHGYGETFTADADYVPFDGSLVRGRQAVVDSHASRASRAMTRVARRLGVGRH